MRLGMTAVSRQAPPAPMTASLVNQAVAAGAGAAAAKAGAATHAAPQPLQKAAARGLQPAVRAKAVRAKKVAGVAGVAAGPRETSVVPRPRSIAVAAMNLRPWPADARRMTRAWSSSGSRTPAMTPGSVTTVIRQTTTTASLRAASTRCSTCRVGWRRLASSLPAISTPAADPHAGQTLVVVGESRGVTPRREAAHRTGLATPGVAAVRATSGSGDGGNRFASPQRPPAFPCVRYGLGWTPPGMAFPRYGEEDVRQPYTGR
jgi:hypothetical protein